MTKDFLASLESRDRDTLVVAESKSFVAFDQWMDEQLVNLVAKWIHTAAPNANRFELMRQRFGRTKQVD